MQLKSHAWFDQSLPDGGPVYTETDMSQFIVEPWNALSSLFIIVPAIIWLNRIRNEPEHYLFIIYLTVLMIAGGLGSTLFHAFRISKFFLFMDVLPAAIISLSVGIYFWIKVVRKWYFVLMIVLISFAPRYFLFNQLSRHTAINISYAITGFFIALPLIIIMTKTSKYYIYLVVITVTMFSLALFFREADTYSIPFLPMGSHFLWHVFSGFGAYFLLKYLFVDKITPVQKPVA
jgi:hemolysin III